MNEAERTVLTDELVALQEPAPETDELRLLAEGPLASEEVPDLAMVAALVELSQGEKIEPLTELEKARAWRSVQARSGASVDGSEVGASKEVVSGGAARTTRRSWPLAAVGMAAAAAAIFLVLRPSPGPDEASSEEQHELAVGLSEQAREGLSALGVEPGSESARAQEIREAYASRLSADAPEGGAG